MMNLSGRTYSMFDEMLTDIFGFPIERVRKFKNTRTGHSLTSFMQMKIWDVLTEEQFNSLYVVLHTESIESFIEMAKHMNEELRKKTKKERRK
tara:strand:- start:217 stop:495 length:279 start_codon:yes stop_codon:yes gene_type:complete